MAGTSKGLDARKTPRQGRSAATVDIILEAVARILETGGLGALTTNAVAATAGISIGSLYQYFPGKEALLAALIRRKRQELIIMLEQVAATDNGADLGELVIGFVRAALHHQFQRPRLAAGLEYAEAILPLDDETRILKKRIVEIVAEALSRYGIDQPDVAARDLAALTRGMADAASLAGETDASQFEPRVLKAVHGYLGL